MQRKPHPIVMALLALTLIACTPSSPSSRGSADSTTIPTTIRVGVVPAPPISQIDPKTLQAKGYAIDLMNAFAERSSLKVEYVPVDWANMSAALKGDRVDVVAGPIFETEARAKEFAFAPPLWTYAVIAVRRKDSSVVRSRNDLVTKPVRISVGRGGFDSEFATRMMKTATIRVIPPEQPDGSMLEVLSGRADVALVDRATAQRFMKAHPELTLVDGGAPVSLQVASFMVEREDQALRELFEVGLRNLAVSGEMEVLAKPYESDNAWHRLPLADQYGPGLGRP